MLSGPRARLASEARSLLSKNPAGMCGGLLNQRIRQAEQNSLEVAYGLTKEQQKGWLQDLMMAMPDVKCRKEGRDNWYFMPGAEATGSETQVCETASGESEARPPPGHAAAAAAPSDASPAAWLQRLKGGECVRRYKRLWGGKPPAGVPLLFLVGYVSLHLLYVLFHG